MNIVPSIVTRNEFDALKDTMQMYQRNIDNNITWFYTALAIVVAVLIVGLIVIVRASIKSGIEKGIEDVRKYYDQTIEEIKKGSIIESGSNNNGQYYIWGNNRIEITTRVRLRVDSPNRLNGVIIYPAAFSQIHHVNLALKNSKESTIENYSIITKSETTTSLFVEVVGGINTKFNQEDEIFITAHVIGTYNSGNSLG